MSIVVGCTIFNLDNGVNCNFMDMMPKLGISPIPS